MSSRTLFFVLAVVFVLVFFALLFFGFGDGFGGRGYGMGADVPRIFWWVLIVVPLVVLVTVLGYSLLFPELVDEKAKEKVSSVPAVERRGSVLSAVLRVLNDDERKVVETLVAEGGTMLQKDIRWKIGFSRVKTHRILFRLAKRGMVSAEKYYNTNRITLAEWLTKEDYSGR